MTGRSSKASTPGQRQPRLYIWVDRYNTFGLGANVPIAQDLRQRIADGGGRRKIIDIRVPYPLGFFTKNVDGRIDDPQAGWKGRAMWTTSGTRTNFHNEGGTTTSPSLQAAAAPIRSRGNPHLQRRFLNQRRIVKARKLQWPEQLSSPQSPCSGTPSSRGSRASCWQDQNLSVPERHAVQALRNSSLGGAAGGTRIPARSSATSSKERCCSKSTAATQDAEGGDAFFVEAGKVHDGKNIGSARRKCSPPTSSRKASRRFAREGKSAPRSGRPAHERRRELPERARAALLHRRLQLDAQELEHALDAGLPKAPRPQR